MELYGQHDPSTPQKIVINGLEILFMGLSYWILFGTGELLLTDIFPVNAAPGTPVRRTVLMIFNVIIFLRLGYMMFFLLKRKIPWEESISIPLAFAMYYLGFTLFILPVSQPLDIWDAVGIGLFLTGGVLNTGGEVLRDRWKKEPGHQGKLYTGGFFKYSRHINYFGDLLWVSGYALITHNPWSVSIPLFLFCFFAFYNAPKLDSYLRQKYGAAYHAYAAETKMLIPFIY